MLSIIGVCHAQPTTPEILTNAKIVAMIKGGLPKAAIVASIQNKATNFDVSTDAMIALKRQGVADDVITAMVTKNSKPVAPPIAPKPVVVATTPTTYSQDCKYTQMKSKDGQIFSMVQVAGKIGNFLVGKSDGKYSLIYSTKTLLAFFANDAKNRTSLRIDSVRFLFADDSFATLKVVGGFGSLANENSQLKPQMMDVKFSILLEPGSKAETSFRQTKMRLFTVFAEKSGQYGDLFNDKQQDKMLQAFTCIQ